MDTGEMIKAIRKRKGMTQKQVAERCGMADSAIRKYESGAVNPKLETLQKIADALDVPLWGLLPESQRELYKSVFEFGIQGAEVFTETEIYDALEAKGYSFSKDEETLIQAFSTLNETGRQKAVEQVSDLAKILDYQKAPDKEE